MKYTLTEGDSIVTASRLATFMKRDSHTDGRKEYLIRSLYFDNLYDKALREKLSGIAIRDKFRIRYYDFNADFIRLEKKSKRYSLGHKYQCRLTSEEVERILRNDWDWMAEDERPLVRELYLKMKLELFRPIVIVDYRREPFIYAPGNVRITFDRDIRSCKDVKAFFRKYVLAVPVLPDGKCIMEVKYDDFLPDVVSRTVLTTKNREQAYSKFAACRING
ncbi:MAG: polyphosphate polymerase domain-containing protein [Anaerotignum sp.]|nr:polyphosphate polymerase domain-containing protein [Anaerotignum sp.]